MSRLLAALTLLLSLPGLGAAQIAVTSGTLVEQRTAMGQEYLTNISLHNSDSVSRVARLTRRDYRANNDGVQAESPALGQQLRSNALWLHDVPASVIVPPGRSATVTVRVVVPNDSSLRGTYWSAILVETGDESEPVLEVAGDDERKTFGIATRIRYAVQVATHIGTAATSELAFADVRSTVDSTGQPVLEFAVQNPGERGLRPKLSLELYNADGEIIARQQQQRGLLYPGDHLQQRFRLEGVTPGEYTALVLADAGGSEVFGAQLRLRF